MRKLTSLQLLSSLEFNPKNFAYRQNQHKTYIKYLQKNFLKQKLWAVCDLAMNVIFTKTTNFDLKEFPTETRIPTMYFKKTDEMINTKIYLPSELQINMNNPKGKNSTFSSLTSERPQRKTKTKQKETGIGPNETDARVRV